MIAFTIPQIILIQILILGNIDIAQMPLTKLLYSIILNNKTMPDIPHCYFHQSQKITQMCLSQHCTMPLCSLCINDHINKNQSGQCGTRVVSFDKAQNFAYQAACEELKAARQRAQQFQNMYDSFRRTVIQTMEQCLTQLYDKLKDQIISPRQTPTALEQRKQKVSQNNLKQIISLYLDIFKSPTSYPQLNYNINVQSLKKQLQQFIIISKPEQVPSLPIKKCKKQMCEKTCISLKECNNNNTEFQFKEQGQRVDNNQRENLNQREKNLIAWLVEENRQMFGKEKHEGKEKEKGNGEIGKRKNRSGIFVASSPNRNQADWIKNRSKTNFTESNFGKKYTSNQNQFSICGSKTLRIDSIEQPIKQRHHFRPHSTKHSSKPSPIILQIPQRIFISKPQHHNLEAPTHSHSQQSVTLKNSTINTVINKQSLASNSSSSRLILRNRNTNSPLVSKTSRKQLCSNILNPQEMRQLILRKKNGGLGERIHGNNGSNANNGRLAGNGIWMLS